MATIDIEKIKAGERKRSKKYWDEHKDEIKARRAEKYVAIKQARIAARAPVAPAAAPEPARRKLKIIPKPAEKEIKFTKSWKNKDGNVIKTQIIYKDRAGNVLREEEIHTAPEVAAAPAPAPTSTKTIYTIPELIDQLEQLSMLPAGNKEKIAINTFKTDKSGLKRLSTIIGSDDIIKAMKNPDKVVKSIEKSIQPNGEPYSDNSKKATYQIVLKSIDKFNLDVTEANRTKIYDAFKRYDFQSRESTKEKAASNEGAVPTFAEYLRRVKGKYPELSKQYLIPKIADEITARDNFYLIRTSNEKDTVGNIINWVVIDRTKPVKIVINEHKTKHSGSLKKTLSPELSTLIRRYAKDNKVEEGEPLFGIAKLYSAFVINLTKELGFDLPEGDNGITLFRRMKVAETFAKYGINDLVERQRVAKEMGHSLYMQQYVYKRNQI